jgi:ATP-dependent Clp protease ATP-binding subunit ClpC
MTSNIGVKQLKDFGQGVGFATQAREENKEDHSKSVIQNALKRTFSPEFLNRIDDVVIFNSLEQEDILQIVNLAMAQLKERIDEMGYEVKLSKKAGEFLGEKGYDRKFGARPLHRAIQKYVEDPLAEYILSSNPEQGSVFSIDLNKDKDGLLVKEVKKKAKSETIKD